MPEPGTTIVVEGLDRSVLDGFVPGEDEPAIRADVGLFPYFVDERPLQGLAGFVDWRSSGRLSALLRDGVCSGVDGEVLLLPGRPTLPVDRVVLVGLGASHAFDRERAREAGRAMVTIARRLRATEVLLAMPGRLEERSVSEAVFTALAEALRESRDEADWRERPRHDNPIDESTGRSAGGQERWWVVAEPRHVSRLRRLLEGPPRPADPA